jgi:N utilization substance protein B
MSRRRKAREIAVQLLFKDDFNPDQQSLDEVFVSARLNHDSALTNLACNLIDGVRSNKTRIDEEIKSLLDNWKLERLSATERNILRLGIYEILFTDTPGPVVINEAIEITKRYGNEQSHQFVNGVLDKFLQKQMANN